MNLEFKYQNELKLEFRFTSVTHYDTMLVSQFFLQIWTHLKQEQKRFCSMIARRFIKSNQLNQINRIKSIESNQLIQIN